MKAWICHLCGQRVRTPYTLPEPPVCTHKNTPKAAAKACPMQQEPS